MFTFKKVFKSVAELTVILSTVSLGMSPQAWAWGSYGHQQVNVAAVELLGKLAPTVPLAQCMVANAKMIQRLAISPDYDWKKLGTEIDANYVNVPPAAKKLPDGTRNPDFHSTDPRHATDKYEHPLHYFESDAFVDGNAILTLPTGKFRKVVDQLIKLRFAKDRAAYVAAIDPSKASKPGDDPIDGVRVHGTAPWRIAQLYDLAVVDLKAGRTKRALILLGAMGHYVGDMSQPFHTSLNFDGEYDPNHRAPVLSSGIHAAFESDMFKLHPEIKDPNKTTFMYESFGLTDAGVLDYATKTMGDKKIARIRSADIVREVLSVIDGSQKYQQPLLDALWKEAAAHPKAVKPSSIPSPTASSAVSAGTSTPGMDPVTPSTIVNRKPSSLGLSVLKVAEERMAASSVLLVRLWLSAFQDAGKKMNRTCEVFYDGSEAAHATFRREVVESYPVPNYLPEGHLLTPRKSTAPANDDNADEEAPSTPLKPSAAAVRAFSDDEL